MDDLIESVGVIEGINVSTGSGIGQLTIRRPDGELKVLLCEAAPTLRAISAMASSLGRGGAALRLRFPRGLRVRYSTDDLGLLAALGPDGEETVPCER